MDPNVVTAVTHLVIGILQIITILYVRSATKP